MSDESRLVDDQPPRPTWDDAYLEAVANRLMYHYDLEKDRMVDDTTYDLYGILQVESKTHIFHPLLDYGNHFDYEHLFVERVPSITEREIREQVERGHALANEWIIPDAEHHSTSFTFISIVPSIPSDVESFVSGFKDRTLLKMGYHGHYEVNLVVVSPENVTLVASDNADVHRAFATWTDVGNRPKPGLIGRVIDALRR